MSQLQFISFVSQVEQMRNAQQDYFQKAAKARKTKSPGDWAMASNALKASKQIEEEVDRSVASLKTLLNVTVIP